MNWADNDFLPCQYYHTQILLQDGESKMSHSTRLQFVQGFSSCPKTYQIGGYLVWETASNIWSLEHRNSTRQLLKRQIRPKQKQTKMTNVKSILLFTSLYKKDFLISNILFEVSTIFDFENCFFLKWSLFEHWIEI